MTLQLSITAGARGQGPLEEVTHTTLKAASTQIAASTPKKAAQGSNQAEELSEHVNELKEMFECV